MRSALRHETEITGMSPVTYGLSQKSLENPNAIGRGWLLVRH